MGIDIQNDTTNNVDQMVEYFRQFGKMLQNYDRNIEDLRNVAEKQGNVRNKKKNSSMYGSWGIRKDENGGNYENEYE